MHLPAPRIIALALGLSPTSLAHAEPHPEPYPVCVDEPSETQVSGAKGAYKAGQVSFEEADYARAILYWEDAFRRDCTASKLLLNLARAYELSDKKEHAILSLETFLERTPDSPDRASIEKRIKFLRTAVDREDLEAAEAQARTETPGPAGPESGVGPSGRRPAWPVVLTGAGVAVGATGLVLFLSAQATLSGTDCSQDNPPVCMANPDAGTATPEEERQRAASAQTLSDVGAVMGIAGGAVSVAGGIFWYVLWKDRDAPPVAQQLQPIAAPGLVGLTFRGSF